MTRQDHPLDRRTNRERLWLRDEIVSLLKEARSLQQALIELADKNRAVMIPGYTHLQRAQPVYFAHHLLAYVEMLARDDERLRQCFGRVNVCPLGSGAIAGCWWPQRKGCLRPQRAGPAVHWSLRHHLAQLEERSPGWR